MTKDHPPRTSPMWGGRFGQGPHAVMASFNACLAEDQRFAQEDIDGSVAHASMLASAGIVTRSEKETIVAGLETIRREIEAESFPWREELEDVHMNIEARLRELIGEVAGKLHTGRSRNDQVATDLKLWTRRRLSDLASQLTETQRALVGQATGHSETVMPGFTHLQIAQPISYAFWCLAWTEMFERDRRRMLLAIELAEECPLGAAALAGTPHPIEREETATALGFARPMANALDAVSSRDFIVDALSCALSASLTISRLAEELVLFATPRFGYVRISDAFSTGSSIMPQKRNPDAAELLRAQTAEIAGAHQTAVIALKGLPLAYSKDLQTIKPALLRGIDSLAESLSVLTLMIGEMKPDPSAMARDAGSGFSVATDIADRLATQGLPFREAHHIVGKVVARCEALGVGLDALPADEAMDVSERLNPDVMADLTPLGSIRSKKSFGSAHPKSVEDALSLWEKRLGERSV